MTINAIRIAKFIANAGFCSRREAETLIFAGHVKVNGEVTLTPTTHVSVTDIIEIEGEKLKIKADGVRLWTYYKPIGLITSNKDEHDRPTIFEALPKSLPRVISIGRLDLNSEGLLLLTNSGKLARYLELPKHEFIRVYKVRAFGEFNMAALKQLEDGIEINSIKYRPAKINVIKTGKNSWFLVELSEGKNREIRKLFSYINLSVNRLIRVKYGPFELQDLEPGEVKEIDYIKFAKYFPKNILEV